MNATVTQVKTTDNMAGLIRHDAHYFCARTIDGQRALLEQSYRLRYQVYCLERKFLRAEDYPNGLEIDVFDRHAAHIGAAGIRFDLRIDDRARDGIRRPSVRRRVVRWFGGRL